MYDVETIMQHLVLNVLKGVVPHGAMVIVDGYLLLLLVLINETEFVEYILENCFGSSNQWLKR